MLFPNVDPIPIPAPVWLMKTLSLLTLTLHFFAVHILIGSLLAVGYFMLRGKKTGDPAALSAAAVLGRRLPIVMTYVINLGVPPLLFAQVLYGRALYTSSVLMGALWISVVFILMACYWLLYRISDLTHQSKSAIWQTLAALALAGVVGQFFSFNMTLMLRPEVWPAMYAHSPSGLQVPPHDPTVMPRWFFTMVGGLVGGGLWVALNSSLKTIDEDTSRLMRRFGAGFAAVGALVQVVFGYVVYQSQPQNVQEGLQGTFYKVSAGLWSVGLLLVVLLAVAHFGRKSSSLFLGWAAPVGAFLSIAGTVIYRDGIRDVTLLAKGFDVWKRTEISNWSVIGIFIALLLVGLGTVGWLLFVMKLAKPVSEQVTL